MACCSELLRLLMDFLEERLPPEVHADLQHHLEGCTSCVNYLRTYRTTVSLLHSLRESDLPPELRTRLRAFIDDHPQN